MRLVKRTPRAVIYALLAAVGVQTPGLAPMADAQFKSESNLVILDVTVKDKAGNALTGLKKEDFVILEDGKPQQIGVFEFQKLSSDAPAPPKVAANKIAAADGKATVGKGAPVVLAKPDVKGGIRYQDRRLVVMLFDMTSMEIAEQARVQDSAIKFIKEQLKPADLVSIFSFASTLKVEQDFTDDKDRLEEVVRSFKIGEASALATDGGDGDDANGEDNGTAFNPDETEFNIFNTDRKLAALESAAKMLGALPEKKALVYFSNGISKSGMDNQAQLRSTVAAAVRSNVAFYPIDARGLIASAPGGNANTAASRGNSMFTGARQGGLRAATENQQDTLVTLAADTGGKAFMDDNDLSLGMAKARDDVESYYIVGYYSSNGANDGKFRRVQVKLANASLNAKLEYRSGYYAQKTFSKFTSADKESQLQEALLLGDPITDLPLAVETDYFRIARDKYYVPVSVKIPGSEISMLKKKGAESTEFEFIGQIRDEKGKLAGALRDGIPVKMKEETAAQLSQRSIQYNAGFVLPPGKYTLKFLSRENTSGKMGTFESKFEIPDLVGGPATGLKISSVIWSSQRAPMSSAIASADGGKKKLVDYDPLVQDGQRLVPSVTKVFRRDQNLYVYVEVYDPAIDAGDKKPSVSATLSLYRGRAKSFESEPIRISDYLAKRGPTLPLKFQAPLAGVAPGRYTCQINIIDENGKKFAFPRTEIVILPNVKAVVPAAL